MIIAGTGHRPNKLGGYGKDVQEALVELAREELLALPVGIVISGMALGWDQALAEAAWGLKIPFHAYIPFLGQESKWPKESALAYHDLLKLADKIVVCSSPPYMSYKMHIRNQKMVDAADQMLALWDGSSGGTSNCVVYAMSKKKPIMNCWERWKKLRSGVKEPTSCIVGGHSDCCACHKGKPIQWRF